jgi:hypothetical protein
MFRERTPWMPDTTQPIWNQYMIYDFAKSRNPPPKEVSFEIWNKNYVMDEFLGAVKIPLSTVSSQFPLSQSWMLSPSPNTNSQAYGSILLRIHHRKKYDDVSEAAEEIRLINGIVREELGLLAFDESILSTLNPRSPEHYNVTYRISLSKEKIAKCQQRKTALIGLTLTKRPLTPFEVEDSNVWLNSLVVDVVRRKEKYDELIHVVTEELRTHRLFNETDSSISLAIKEKHHATELRLEYLLYYAALLAYLIEAIQAPSPCS